MLITSVVTSHARVPVRAGFSAVHACAFNECCLFVRFTSHPSALLPSRIHIGKNDCKHVMWSDLLSARRPSAAERITARSRV